MTLQNNTIIYNLRAIQTSSEHAYKKKTKSRVGKLIKSPTVGNIYGVLDIWLHGNYHGMHTLEYLKERERERTLSPPLLHPSPTSTGKQPSISKV